MSRINTLRPQPQRQPLTDEDRRLIRKWYGGFGFTSEVAKTVREKQKDWISPKQREVLQRDGKPPLVVNGRLRRRRSTHPVDYDESDWEISAFELCVDGWGD